jgi:glutathione S-transferase
MVDPEHTENSAELARRSAMGKFPLLVEGGAVVFEATAIIEYLEAVHPRSGEDDSIQSGGRGDGADN